MDKIQRINKKIEKLNRKIENLKVKRYSYQALKDIERISNERRNNKSK